MGKLRRSFSKIRLLAPGKFEVNGALAVDLDSADIQLPPRRAARALIELLTSRWPGLAVVVTSGDRVIDGYIPRHEEKPKTNSRIRRGVLHYAEEPFVALCGDDNANQRTTTVLTHVTCRACRVIRRHQKDKDVRPPTTTS